MLKQYRSYPCVNAALAESRDGMFRGNTFGQAGSYHQVTDEDRERASRFNVKDALEKAIELRKLNVCETVD